MRMPALATALAVLLGAHAVQAKSFKTKPKAHKANAEAYLAFLASAPAQEAYAKFGFVKARPDELALKPID